MSTTLPETDPYENPVIEFDFAAELDGVDSATVSVSVASGRDPSPIDLVDGAPQISTTKVLQAIASNMAVDGVDYRIRCEAVRGTDKRVLVGILPVRRS